MDHDIFEEISDLSRSGAEVLLGTDRYGRCKAKVRFGLFKSRIKRFVLDHETYQALKVELRPVRQS